MQHCRCSLWQKLGVKQAAALPKAERTTNTLDIQVEEFCIPHITFILQLYLIPAPELLRALTVPEDYC